MKSFLVGFFALGLTVWPFALAKWVFHIEHTHVHAKYFPWDAAFPFMVISGLAGGIVAIVGTMISNDETNFALWLFGRALCIITLCIGVAIVILFIYGLLHLGYGVN